MRVPNQQTSHHWTGVLHAPTATWSVRPLVAIFGWTRRLAPAMKSVSHRLIDSRAQAAFEFLLILPIFIPVTLLTVDFGMMLYEYVSLNNAANEGARYAAVNCDTGTCTVAEIQDQTVTRSGGILGSGDTGEVSVAYRNVNGNSTDGATGKGDSVVVRVTHTYNFLFFPFSQTVSSCSDYRLEQADGGSGLPTGDAC